MNPVVSASYAQSGVDAVGRRLRLRRTGYLQWHGEDDPVAVETGYCAAANSLRGIRPLYDTGYEPALRCYPASSRERCVQSSLPCVSSSGKKSQASKLMALSVGRFLWKDCLQKRIETGKIRCGNHLGCRKGFYGIAVRTKWQSGSDHGDRSTRA